MRQKILEFLQKIEQPHLAHGLESLCEKELLAFYEELQTYAPLLQVQQSLLHTPFHQGGARPYSMKEQEKYEEVGREWVRAGKVGCLILAGGQGSRLGSNGPKGAVPVMPISKKTLFHVLSEKVKVASEWAGKPLPLAVMTSKENHNATVSFFESYEYFGLPSVSFFSQGELPALNEQGDWFLEKSGKLATLADGNGHALHHFVKSGIWDLWKQQGIEHVSVVFVDNPLANPFDFSMVGLAVNSQADSVIKAIDRLGPKEPMGVIAEKEGKIGVVEYFELTDEEKECTLSSTGMLCLAMPFIQELVQQELPLHLAWKEEKRFGRVGKCERFLFDLLAFAKTSAVYKAERFDSYAPLKNRTGDRSLESVQRAVLAYHRSIYQKLTGQEPSISQFELAPCFDYAEKEIGDLLREYPLSSEECLTVAILKKSKGIG